MHNVGIVVESLDDAISFFTEIGLKLEGRMMVEGEWAGRVTGLGNQSVEIAMMVTPDGNSRLELSRFLAPHTITDHRTAPMPWCVSPRTNINNESSDAWRHAPGHWRFGPDVQCSALVYNFNFSNSIQLLSRVKEYNARYSSKILNVVRNYFYYCFTFYKLYVYDYA